MKTKHSPLVLLTSAQSNIMIEVSAKTTLKDVKAYIGTIQNFGFDGENEKVISANFCDFNGKVLVSYAEIKNEVSRLNKEINKLSLVDGLEGSVYLKSFTEHSGKGEIEEIDAILERIKLPKGWNRSNNQVYKKGLTIYISSEPKQSR